MYPASYLRNQGTMASALLSNTSLARRLLWYHLPVLLYASAIMTLSSIPFLGGPSLSVVGLDKLIHGVEYGILTWLLLRSIHSTNSGINVASLITITLLVVAAFSGMDEYLQSFVDGRTSSVADFAADMVGCGLVCWYFRSKRGQK